MNVMIWTIEFEHETILDNMSYLDDYYHLSIH